MKEIARPTRRYTGQIRTDLRRIMRRMSETSGERGPASQPPSASWPARTAQRPATSAGLGSAAGYLRELAASDCSPGTLRSYRILIGQAQGLLMERFAIDADQAFAVLRRYSQDNNVKLRIVADELVTTRRLPTRSPAHAADGSPGDQLIGGTALLADRQVRGLARHDRTRLRARKPHRHRLLWLVVV
jgi:hypothetical protein